YGANGDNDNSNSKVSGANDNHNDTDQYEKYFTISAAHQHDEHHINSNSGYRKQRRSDEQVSASNNVDEQQQQRSSKPVPVRVPNQIMLGAGSPRMGRRHSDSTPYRMSSASPTATPSPTPSNVTNLVGGGERPSSALPATGRAINNSSSATYGGAGPNSQTVPQFVIGATDIGGSAELPTVPTVAPPSELEQNNVMQAFDVAARMPFDVTGPEWAAWRLYAGHRRRQPLTPLAANLVDSQAAAATCGADASGTTQGGAVHSMLGSGAVSDAISAAYTSLRQRPSFSGLSAALTGGSSLNSATGNSTTGATDNTMSQQFASDSTPAATSALSSSPSEKRCTEATLLLTIEQEIAQRIQLQWAHMRASNGRISAPERVTLWAFDKRPNDAQQQQQSMSEQLISVGGVTAETGGAGAATAAEQQVHTISSISRHNSDRVRAILANARQLKGKERKSAIEILRCGAANMDKWRHLKMVHVVRSLEESSDALAFVSEPLACSLDTLLATMRRCGAAADNSSPYYANAQQQHQCQCLTPFELKYGLLQLTEALLYLHYSCRVIHRNVCPASVLINERRTWKLAGLEFALKCTDGPSDATVPRPCPAYNVKGGRVMQPETNFCAPEVFLTNTCSAQSDMFALGLLIGALFSAFGLAGHSASASASSSTDDRSHQLSLASTHLADQENTQAALMIQCNGNPAIYLKQLEQLNVAIPRVMPHVPTTLREPLRALLDVDASRRPTSESFSMVNYFSDDGVHALQYLDMIEQQDSVHKSNYYYNLTGVLPSIPKRMWWAHILASILSECLKHELHAATVEPLVWMVREASAPEYAQILLPFIKILFVMPKSVQTHVALLENFCSLHNCTSSSTLSLTSCTLSGGDTEMLQLKSRTKTSTERKREKRKKLNQDHSTGPIDSRYSIQRDFNDNHATMINNDSITTMLNAAATTTTTSSLISNSSLDDDDELDNDFDDDDELDYHDDDDERLMNANQVPTSANFGSNSADQLTAPRVKQLKVELDVELAETMLVALDSPVDQIQAAALKACAWVAPHLSTCTLAKARVVPKVRAAFEANIDNTSVSFCSPPPILPLD
ncbi:SCY1-like protein 2, partial [Fragariocoptes setiger]